MMISTVSQKLIRMVMSGTTLTLKDGDDPLMVSEYINEILDYMENVELATLPNFNYMSSQKELAWWMRCILLDWLVQARFRLLPETFSCVLISLTASCRHVLCRSPNSS
ncbi:hypothetical protein JVT61DRAFT_10547 [Boletus reticuloceps]|uniref:Cyclin N-terminal domain-containing protein n=1 Tax=Boletus reticuloceps TaxID=495285 RepID=A0A8I2YWK9_9AGAM|nr:hypothetical protein JVT61DRAFT_10547 [Boletus reticuloceps]